MADFDRLVAGKLARDRVIPQAEATPTIITANSPQCKSFLAIIEEREFQDRKFGPGSQHTIGEWILIIEAELAEAKMALIKGGVGRDSVLQEIVQVCAVGVACLEQHGTEEKGRMQPIVDAFAGNTK